MGKQKKRDQGRHTLYLPCFAFSVACGRRAVAIVGGNLVYICPSHPVRTALSPLVELGPAFALCVSLSLFCCLQSLVYGRHATCKVSRFLVYGLGIPNRVGGRVCVITGHVHLFWVWKNFQYSALCI